MVLVDLAIDSRLGFLMTLLDDIFVGYSWRNLLVDGSIMVTSFVPGMRISENLAQTRPYTEQE